MTNDGKQDSSVSYTPVAPLNKEEELREQILTLGVCNGPYDSPHRCSALHCDHCGICDISEDLIALLNNKIREARLDELKRLELLFDVDYLTLKNQIVYRLADLENKEQSNE